MELIAYVKLSYLCAIVFNLSVVYNCFGKNVVNISFSGNGYWWKRERSTFDGNGNRRTATDRGRRYKHVYMPAVEVGGQACAARC
jgi:hypothetical protein